MSERPKKTAPRFSSAARAKLAQVLAQQGLSGATSAPIERRVDRNGPWPLSTSQERLWLAEQVRGGTPLYHVPLAAHLVGPLDPHALQQALGSLVQRYDVLRARIALDDEHPQQITREDVELPLVPLDLAAVPEARRYAHALELARAEFRRPFDLAQGPPVRAALWKLGPEQHLFLLSLHHLVCDGATMRVLCEELAQHYAAERAGRPLSLVEPELQHGDYAIWQRTQVEGAEARAGLDYFAERLRGPLTPLELPSDRPRPAQWSPSGAWRSRHLDKVLGDSLAELAQAHGATPFQLYLAAFHALLFRLTHQDDLVVGIPIGQRERSELERLPGFLVNTLALRTRVDGAQSFVELLARVKDTALEAYAHRAAPFERVLARLQPARDAARTPLFDVMFDHRAGLPAELALHGLTSGRLIPEAELHSGTSKVDLALYTEHAADALVVSAEFRTELFDPATIELLLERFEVLLRAIAGNPHARVDELPLLGAEERARLECWSQGPELSGCETTVHAALAEVAARLPRKFALEHGALRVSYAELLQRAHRLARHLVARGVARGEPVAVCLTRSDELVVAELAILEAGGAYLPLDPNYPRERLRFMLEDSRARHVLSESALAAELPLAGLDVVQLDRERGEIARRSAAPLEPIAGAGDPAYLIYTSGSTGTPKGVACPHRGVLRLFRSPPEHEPWLVFDERVRMVHLAPESFDASVLDIWGPLLGGGTLVLHPERTPTLDGLARVVAEHSIDTLFLTTALFHALVDEAPETLARLRQVATGGEALSLAHLVRARERCPALALANCYGPTEATVIATTWNAPRELGAEFSSAPIGAPIANTCVRVLDEHLEPVPLGVAGELYVGGAAIALGYWQRPELSRERFVPDPLGTGTLYRTGDLVRWRASGARGVLEFLGRRDDQVKIRGHRIELGEIEARLAEHEGVQRALVVAREDVPGAKRLVAYVVLAELNAELNAEGEVARDAQRRATPAELAAHLATRLPEYMRPAAIVLLDELPITPGGKIDRARLPAPELELAPLQHEAPRGATEELLASLWCELLHLERVGRQDDFFALGGQSLAATILIARLKRHFGVELPLAALFRERTLANLARTLEAARRPDETRPTLTPRAGSGPAPPAPNQRGLWFLQQLAPRSPFYNVPFVLPLSGALDERALAQALAELVARHTALRTRFPVLDGQPVQIVDALVAPLATQDLRAAPEPERTADAAVEAFAREPFDLERGPLFRARLLRTADERARLAVNVHHIVFDGWSFEIFVDELARLYAQHAGGAPAGLAPLTLQYADYAAWQAEREEHGDAALSFWKQELAGAPPVLELATDRARPAQPNWRGAKVQRALPAALVARVQALARAEGATPYLVLLTLTELVLARYAGVEDLVVGTPVAARTQPECERLIGLFLNVLAIRADLSGAPSFRELLGRTRERVLRAHAHQDCPFERVVEALGGARDPAVTPVYQVLFSLRRASEARRAGALTIEPALEVDAASAKTDLAITIEERPGDWLLDLSFATDLFDAATLTRFGEHFENLLSAALSEPTRAVWELEWLAQAERARLVGEWSGRAPSFPRHLSLAVLFERAAARHATTTALVLEGQTLTYAELNARANRLARHLVSLGVARESRVALCAERSFEMVVAILAILKAGGAYVPLDPSYPAERLAFMLADAGVEVLLADAELVAELPATSARVLVLEQLDLAAVPDDNLPARTNGDDLAYLMYTSGSRGKPKGVEIPQRAVARLVLASDYVRFDESRVWLQLAPISFDASTLELWGALLHGAKLVLYPERVPTAEELERVLAAHGVTSLWLTAALFNALIDERPECLAGVEECLTGGEALSVAHVRRAHAALPRIQLVNGYGPTENTTFTCCHRIPRELAANASSIPIGKPIANTQVYVVDAHLCVVPIGVPGELVTGGDGLARGYHARPELNAERFVRNPFGAGQLYRTGDRVRWLADGTLEFLGRTDDQVKIRGHRIEPGEIAALLAGHARVRKAFVTVHHAPQTGAQLAAYFEAQDGAPPTSSELAAWLSERLPDYMIPSAILHVAALPMNPNGKVDRKRLPEPTFESRSLQRPRNELENLLATLWQGVLGVADVGPEDDFFELGGHSLLAVKLVQAIRDAFGQELELSALVNAPTLASQALMLHQGVGGKRAGAVVKLQPRGAGTPIFCVCSLGGTVLNQRPLALRLGEEQPFYGLQAIDLDAKLGRTATIEDYAAAYIESMKKLAPRGPYVIGGHSFGGIVSFEIAQQLTRRGDEVAMLFILDSSLPNLDKGALDRLACVFAFLRGLPYLPAEALGQMRRDPEQLARALSQKLRFVSGKARGARPAESKPKAEPVAGARPGAMDVADVVEMSNWPENNRRIAERHWRAVLGYRPQAYPGRITLFRSRFQSPFLGLGSMMGWDRVALGGVDVVRVPGGHLSVLLPPNVDVLARHFRERLARKRRAA
ncbi:MAG: amino acid adenylation domain-containing protein [Planctomycetes bacterium]|nr:amino acid adenylation domain-containing protein [Planctomycetota bacterium]